ncbi:unnamed protein product [Parnassius mnemosyne]|uniref:Uncharacterized protein n=1 Tax=Parnassius mnemosyne TaxID=213953 RepID=A0AAV1KY95_9NEOP
MEKAPGPEKVTNELIKGTLEELLPILTSLFNEILSTGLILTKWKTSNIILIFKKGKKEDNVKYLQDNCKVVKTCDLEIIPDVEIIDIQEKTAAYIEREYDYVSGYFDRCTKKIVANVDTANIITLESLYSVL